MLDQVFQTDEKRPAIMLVEFLTQLATFLSRPDIFFNNAVTKEIQFFSCLTPPPPFFLLLLIHYRFSKSNMTLHFKTKQELYFDMFLLKVLWTKVPSYWSQLRLLAGIRSTLNKIRVSQPVYIVLP